MTSEHARPSSDLSRRGVLRGGVVGAIALPAMAACGSDGGSGAAAPSSGSGQRVTVPAADVPVGEGVILPDARVVVTQPEQGMFHAFSAVCTHQGCLVQSVTDGEIVCPCHASHFAIDDGSVVSGPAPKPLPSLPVEVDGNDVVVG